MEVYAEISRKILEDIEVRKINLSCPYGVKMQRKSGSRACFFECEESAVENLTDYLESKGISWQLNEEERRSKDKKEKKYGQKEKVPRKHGMLEFNDPWNGE